MKLFENKLIKNAVWIILFLSVLAVLGRNINPFSNTMFIFHDETQAARVQEFTFNLQHLQIPPRIAPHFSFGLGYPMFNYYAPFSYWVTSIINLLGVDVIGSLKISFLLALITAFIGMYFLMKQYVSNYGSLLSAVVYTVSPYIAVEIFVRGNLAELWCYALLPLALYFLKTNSTKRVLLSSLVLSFLFTSHNVLSLVCIPIIIIFGIFQEKKLLNMISILGGILLSAYFLIPVIGEINLVYATDVATRTNYRDHFLCLDQLWTGPWGFAGSAPGCENDGLSFMLGKANILLGIAGLVFTIISLYKKKDFSKSQDIAFIAVLMIGSIFMVTADSKFIWQLTESVSSIFQFPWRLLIFILFGLAFFSGFIPQFIPKKIIGIVVIILSVGILYTNHEYFYGNTFSKTEYKNNYLSQEYIHYKVAYKVAEYLPTSANYDYWRSLEKKPDRVELRNFKYWITKEKMLNNNKDSLISTYPFVNKDGQEYTITKNEAFYKILGVKSDDKIATINIHYAPYWEIQKNDQELIPTKFDKLGRPMLQVSNNSFDSITVIYKQTLLQQLSNAISLVSLLALSVYTVIQFKQSWKNNTTKKH